MVCTKLKNEDINRIKEWRVAIWYVWYVWEDEGNATYGHATITVLNEPLVNSCIKNIKLINSIKISTIKNLINSKERNGRFVYVTFFMYF